MEHKEYCDMTYAKKNKNLCLYCSYRQAVPSKNNMFCSELCRLLYHSISGDELFLQDIAKLIRLPKIDLIQMILNLKSQNVDKIKLCKMYDKKMNEQPQTIKFKEKDVEIDFD